MTAAEPCGSGGPTILLSPCVGVCRLDPVSGWCQGCARSAVELDRWGELDDAAKLAIWATLPPRLRAQGIPFHLLPWSGESLIAHLASTFGPGRAWSMGVQGAVAGFAAPAGVPLEAAFGPAGLTLRTVGGALRIEAKPGLRAFELLDRTGRHASTALALHEARLPPPPRAAIAELGADEAALDPAAAGQHLFDLGLGRATAHFCVRTGNPDLVAELRRHVGRSLFDPASRLLPQLLHASPARVVLSPIGRVEVTTPIGAPHPPGRSGPHTHFLPQRRARGGALASNLPVGYAPCAVLAATGRG